MAPLAHFFTLVAVVLQLTHAASTLQKRDLLSCGPPGGALYDPTVYTCYDDARLCPIVNGEPTLSRGMACYSEHMHRSGVLNLVQSLCWTLLKKHL